MFADFPPSSSVILLSLSLWAFCINFKPTAVDPVKAILSIPSWHARYSPIYPGAGTTFKTPSGNPASWNSSASLKAVNGVVLAGLITMVHPAARAGLIFHDIIEIGKFHGII